MILLKFRFKTFEGKIVTNENQFTLITQIYELTWKNLNRDMLFPLGQLLYLVFSVPPKGNLNIFDSLNFKRWFPEQD